MYLKRDVVSIRASSVSSLCPSRAGSTESDASFTMTVRPAKGRAALKPLPPIRREDELIPNWAVESESESEPVPVVPMSGHCVSPLPAIENRPVIADDEFGLEDNLDDVASISSAESLPRPFFTVKHELFTKRESGRVLDPVIPFVPVIQTPKVTSLRAVVSHTDLLRHTRKSRSLEMVAGTLDFLLGRPCGAHDE